MAWNSARYHVDEGVMGPNHRIMAWRSPAGKLAIALTNRTSSAYTFDIAVLGPSRQFSGHRYNATQADVTIGIVQGTTLQ